MPQDTLDSSSRAPQRKPAPKLLVTVDLTGTLISPDRADMKVRAIAAWFGGLMRPSQMRTAGKLLQQLPIGAVVGRHDFQGPVSMPGMTRKLFEKLMGSTKFTPNETVVQTIKTLNAVDGVKVVALSNMPTRALGRLLERAGLGDLDYFSTDNTSRMLATYSDAGASDAKSLGYREMVNRIFDHSPTAVVFIENDDESARGLAEGALLHGTPWKALVVSEGDPSELIDARYSNGTEHVPEAELPEAVGRAVSQLNERLGLGLPTTL